MATNYLPWLKSVLMENQVGSAYYSGYAKSDVLDLLLEILPTGCVQAMILKGCKSDEERERYNLRGVIFWDEGGPRGELGIRDCEWDYPDQLRTIVSWKSKPAPRILFLANEATQVDRHADYKWKNVGDALVGIQILSNANTWMRVQKQHLEWYEANADYREGLRKKFAL